MKYYLLLLVLLITACTAANEPIAQVAETATIAAPTAAPATATATPLPPTLPPFVEPWLTETPTFTPTPIAPTPVPATATPEPAILVEPQPIFTGGDSRFERWSPDGRYFTYFEHTEQQVADSPPYPGGTEGSFVIYDTVSGSKCTDYPLDATYGYEGPGRGNRYLWLPNGEFFIITETERVVQTAVPCGDAAQDLTAVFPQPPRAIGDMSPDQTRLILIHAGGYWLYTLADQSLLPVPEVEADPFNNLAWSPNGRYLAINLAGNYTGNRDPVGGTRILDTTTGQIVARHDWEPINALDGSFGGPVWLNDDELLVTVALDQDPFFMTVAGEVRSLISLFPEETRDIPFAHIYLAPDSNAYHVLLTDFGMERPPIQIYHSDTGEAETLATADNGLSLRSDGQLISSEDGESYLTRHITAVGEPLSAGIVSPCYPFWQPIPTTGYLVETTKAQHIEFRQLPDCETVAVLDAGIDMPANISLRRGLSPDNKWLVFAFKDENGVSSTLWLVSLAEILP